MADLILDEPELITRLEQLARERDTSAKSLLRLAVNQYLEDVGRKKIHAESQAFKAMHSELVKNYPGRYVAVHEGQVIDDDTDARRLYLRIREQFGSTPVLIRQVKDQPENELVFRSPRLGGMQT
jgi:hypothetical protein